ncbi:hypothetical protein L915_03730 [Phytophthora nicotianae]|uniref:Uncharacterized protein n=2 Tax=Phytophthora nicotianae TaxID=4792 RepID=W2QLI1_PHYN3|nr:hypothetical protein PPTG_22290 [Phytophthora nicotianae INRA-310]ETK93017.1 hypothetical protein L915_03730 [Phytophthora nicotianae]ETM52729.1 hypothetical protein L914_03696 [Phytophthora nicotianae]ETN14003.1 hypothetical protein PPTG_22290 [Phytophthora nicotianae INRA-310]
MDDGKVSEASPSSMSSMNKAYGKLTNGRHRVAATRCGGVTKGCHTNQQPLQLELRED